MDLLLLVIEILDKICSQSIPIPLILLLGKGVLSALRKFNLKI